MSQEWSIPALMGLGQGVWKARAVQAGVRVGVFTELDRQGGSATLGALALGLGASERGLGMLATALCALGLLERDGETLCLTPFSKEFLS
jgi:hypothetical protein